METIQVELKPEWHVGLTERVLDELIKDQYWTIAAHSYQYWLQNSQPCVIVFDFERLDEEGMPRVAYVPFSDTTRAFKDSPRTLGAIDRAKKHYKGPETCMIVLGLGWAASAIRTLEAEQSTPLKAYKLWKGDTNGPN